MGEGAGIGGRGCGSVGHGEEQWLHNIKILAEIVQIHGSLFQMSKLLKGVLLNTNDITDHLLSKEDEEPVTGPGMEKGAEEEIEKEVQAEGEKEAEAADGANETLP